jgi:hypothetical protein
MSPSLLTYRMPLPDLVKHLREGLESIHVQAMKLDALWALDKKPAANVPLAVTSEEHTASWRQIVGDEDEHPTLFDLNEPEQRSNKSINTQKRTIKLFFPTLPPSGESRSDEGSVPCDSTSTSVANHQSIGSTTRPIQSTPSVPSANGPSRQSTPDLPKTFGPHPTPSKFRLGAMVRLATMKNRPLVVPGHTPDRGPS